MIKFFAGSCLSGLGIVLKEPYAIYLYGLNRLLKQKLLLIARLVLSLRALIHEFFQQKYNYT